MIKAIGKNIKTGHPVMVIGLSRGNCNKLLADQPILFNVASIGLPPMEVLIMGGETEDTMREELDRLLGAPDGEKSNRRSKSK